MISKSICGLAILLLVVCSTGASTLMASGGNEAASAMSGMTVKTKESSPLLTLVASSKVNIYIE
ncbi:MAG: hypothetical protein GY799_21695 [Desulfobulbaceae bacterium]|nr:hypothetical protein [Desulfobulbaceae bacterium]